jgi:protein subunit release factor A
VIDAEGYKITYVSDTYGRGGQHTNGPDYGLFRCEHAGTRTAVEVHSHEARSQHKARELALMLCAMAVEELSK